jgi:hypothetical protein
MGQLDEEGTAMIKKIFALLFLTLVFFAPASAHIGSPDIIYEGNAGPYKIQATIQPPDVVPGIARILIYFPDQKPGQVIIQPIYYEYGSEGAPKGDVAGSVSPGLYQGDLWLMGFGASGFKISVEGAKGFGSTVVPVPAIATATRKMDAGTGILLLIFGLVLLTSIIFIIGASVGEATVAPGLEISKQRKRLSAVVMSITALALISGLFFANKWWNVVEGNYKKNMYKPISLASTIQRTAEGNELKLELKNHEWLSRKLSDIVPDHGKLMHAFLIGNDGKIFAHLHPLRDDSTSFHSMLPGLPKGTYQLFADVVHKDGIGETMTDTIEINESAGNLKNSDPDDSWANVSASGQKQQLNDNFFIYASVPEVVKAGKMLDLKFRVEDKENHPSQLQPYLGMSGHAVVMKDDGTTFIHLHPMGTISMTAQYALANRTSGDLSLCGPLTDRTNAMYDTMGVVDRPGPSLMHQKDEEGVLGNEISFPYAFPTPGNYRIWVQVKSSGKIYTALFEVKAE